MLKAFLPALLLIAGGAQAALVSGGPCETGTIAEFKALGSAGCTFDVLTLIFDFTGNAIADETVLTVDAFAGGPVGAVGRRVRVIYPNVDVDGPADFGVGVQFTSSVPVVYRGDTENYGVNSDTYHLATPGETTAVAGLSGAVDFDLRSAVGGTYRFAFALVATDPGSVPGGEVPEPSTYAMLGLGVSAGLLRLARTNWRRRGNGNIAG